MRRSRLFELVLISKRLRSSRGDRNIGKQGVYNSTLLREEAQVVHDV